MADSRVLRLRTLLPRTVSTKPREATNEVCVKVLERQVRRRATKLLGRVVQQQAEGVPVARDGMEARPKTYREMVREEPLKADGKRIAVHDAPHVSVTRSARATRKAHQFRHGLQCTSRCEKGACARDTSVSLIISRLGSSPARYQPMMVRTAIV